MKSIDVILVIDSTELTVLYDGSCPICAWEKRNLTRHDGRGRLAFIDIQEAGFDPAEYGLSMDELMGSLHGITGTGRVTRGVDTLIRSYRAVGWR